jgi:LL-diaminopimelate aminotransferase
MLKINLNENYKKLSGNYLFSQIREKVTKYKEKYPNKEIINLGIGDVTRPLSPAVILALHKAVDEMADEKTFRGYPPEQGYDFLRAAAANYYNNIICKDEVFISDGAKCDIANITDILGENKVLLPTPAYPIYYDSNLLAGNKIKLVSVNTNPKKLKKNPYVIYLCSPNNPTGKTYGKIQLEKWVSFAVKTGSLIIYDSAYEAYIGDGSPHSIFEIAGAKDCCIEIGSLSKTAGFTGLRCSWTIIPKESPLYKLWKRRQTVKFNGVSYIIQRAAETALSAAGIDENKKNIAYYKRNAEIITKKYNGQQETKNSPYVWVKCPENMTSWEYFDYLLNQNGIVGTPGVGFGKKGEGYLRLTGFGRHSDLQKQSKNIQNS